ncbi:MAG TPA: hypothetical protein VFF87_12085 [Hyphomicrobium sp.]|nr:hypothetical protein [Hyphomicrobium sp.]
MAKRRRVWLRMTYRCCGMEWTDDWPEAFRLECPDCGVLVEAYRIVEIAPPKAEMISASTAPHSGSRSPCPTRD